MLIAQLSDSHVTVGPLAGDAAGQLHLALGRCSGCGRCPTAPYSPATSSTTVPPRSTRRSVRWSRVSRCRCTWSRAITTTRRTRARVLRNASSSAAVARAITWSITRPRGSSCWTPRCPVRCPVSWTRASSAGWTGSWANGRRRRLWCACTIHRSTSGSPSWTASSSPVRKTWDRCWPAIERPPDPGRARSSSHHRQLCGNPGHHRAEHLPAGRIALDTDQPTGYAHEPPGFLLHLVTETHCVTHVVPSMLDGPVVGQLQPAIAPRTAVPPRRSKDGWETRTRTETARLQRPAGCRLPHLPPARRSEPAPDSELTHGEIGFGQRTYGCVGYADVGRPGWNLSLETRHAARSSADDRRASPMTMIEDNPARAARDPAGRQAGDRGDEGAAASSSRSTSS